MFHPCRYHYSTYTFDKGYSKPRFCTLVLFSLLLKSHNLLERTSKVHHNLLEHASSVQQQQMQKQSG